MLHVLLAHCACFCVCVCCRPRDAGSSDPCGPPGVCDVVSGIASVLSLPFQSARDDASDDAASSCADESGLSASALSRAVDSKVSSRCQYTLYKTNAVGIHSMRAALRLAFNFTLDFLFQVGILISCLRCVCDEDEEEEEEGDSDAHAASGHDTLFACAPAAASVIALLHTMIASSKLFAKQFDECGGLQAIVVRSSACSPRVCVLLRLMLRLHAGAATTGCRALR